MENPTNIANKMLDELKSSQELCSPFNSGHQGYAVILEELDELWDEVRKKNPSKELMREEAIQIGAMAMRFIYDLCMKDEEVLDPKFYPKSSYSADESDTDV